MGVVEILEGSFPCILQQLDIPYVENFFYPLYGSRNCHGQNPLA